MPIPAIVFASVTLLAQVAKLAKVIIDKENENPGIWNTGLSEIINDSELKIHVDSNDQPPSHVFVGDITPGETVDTKEVQIPWVNSTDEMLWKAMKITPYDPQTEELSKDKCFYVYLNYTDKNIYMNSDGDFDNSIQITGNRTSTFALKFTSEHLSNA